MTLIERLSKKQKKQKKGPGRAFYECLVMSRLRYFITGISGPRPQQNKKKSSSSQQLEYCDQINLISRHFRTKRLRNFTFFYILDVRYQHCSSVLLDNVARSPVSQPMTSLATISRLGGVCVVGVCSSGFDGFR